MIMGVEVASPVACPWRRFAGRPTTRGGWWASCGSAIAAATGLRGSTTGSGGRTLRCPLTPAQCARVRDGRLATDPPASASLSESRVERVVSINGNLQVAGQKIQVGKVHARKLVTVVLDEHTITVYDNGTPIKAVSRHSTTTLNRTKAHHRITG
jgi:hypothetical protein